PKQLKSTPNRQESFDDWQQKIALIPKPINRAITQTYGGLSSSLVQRLLQSAGLAADAHTETLSTQDWLLLFQQWQWWLATLDDNNFTPALTQDGYSVMGASGTDLTVSQMLSGYYTPRLEAQSFQQLRHQLLQCLVSKLKKLRHKRQQFQSQLAEVPQAESYREQADLLMAYLHQWQPGLASITLPHFETGDSVSIKLKPEQNAVQNAQYLYKRHQKLKRSRDFLAPLIQEVETEIDYLEQVEDAIAVIDTYQAPIDLITLQDIRDELVQQGYLSIPDYRRATSDQSYPYRTFETPGHKTVFVGRNNKQNDVLTFRTAGPYDLWFHAQEISGSHLLLRLDAGAQIEEQDLSFCANLAAYYSRARNSEQVPVVYTKPKYVFKPRGAKPGMTVYTHETVIWGEPNAVDIESVMQNHGQSTSR
ncbi:MAG: NFACT family protein, partial [Cyanobacteria bacterium P01_F01_bin.42]